MEVIKEALTSNPELKVITNDSKYLSKKWLESGKEFNLHDIILNELIIQNRKDLPKSITLNYLYDTYATAKRSRCQYCYMLISIRFGRSNAL